MRDTTIIPFPPEIVDRGLPSDYGQVVTVSTSRLRQERVSDVIPGSRWRIDTQPYREVIPNRCRVGRCPHIKGVKVTAVVPSGASTGIYETLELSDGESDYLGKMSIRLLTTSCYIIMKDDFNHLGSSSCVQLGANGIIDACKPGAIVNGIRLYKAKIEEQQVNID
ncbi:hypothetical protein F2Q70_00045204 [Brassica cretica]|uniref:Uncharacterized protein n=1 Tax=Brassica cretica TaxID=69181 RepID=A0A8S9KGI1_BRACR|nr:hypothetical protein F2Q70_00045204 [Brassica cretica]